MRDLEQMHELQKLSVDYLGLIFYQDSKRYAEPVIMKKQSEIKELTINKVGVFVNEDAATIEEAIKNYNLHAVQLHGDESAAFCKTLMDEVKVIKAFRVAEKVDLDNLIHPFRNACDYFLFDTETAMYGGSGKKFDWTILKKAKINKPFFLSGGIEAEDVQKIKDFQHPFFYAVDLNSRFEVQPGMKDLNSIKKFIGEVHSSECT